MLATMTDKVVISNSSDEIVSASHIILPGVGAFGAAMDKIKKQIPLALLAKEVVGNKKPFLGICVGLQVLAETGYEFGEHQGLGWIHGEVLKLDSEELPLPHIGWNNILARQAHPLLSNIENNQDFYFVHSYVFRAKTPANIIAQTEYGQFFNSIIAQDNICGVQFHPEKSQKAGKLLLKNFLNL